MIEDPTKVAESIDTMSESIFNYGAATVIIASFLLLFFIIIIAIFLANQKQLGKIMKQNEALVKAIINNNNNDDEHEVHQKKKDLVQMYMNINFIFKDACKNTLLKSKADRVGIYVFHNGNATLHGLPFFKMSCIGESVIFGNGINTKGKSDTDIPLHMFSNIIEDLYRNGEYHSIRNDNEPELADFIANSKINFIFIKGIYSKDNSLAGFTISEFNQAITDENEINEIRKSMTELNDKVREIIINPQVKYNLENRY